MLKALKPTTEKRTEKIKDDFIVFDIETAGLNATKKAFLFGVVYGRKNYQLFFNADEMADYLLNCGYKYVFAHNGGKFDYLVLFGNIIKQFNTSIIYVDSRFICFEHNKTKFCDSLNILPTSVKNIGQALNLDKLEIDKKLLKSKTKLEHCNQKDFDYCKRDCEIIYKALLAMFIECGTIKITIGALSLAFFRNKYLEMPIYYNQHVYNFFNSYTGGRCEAFKIGKTKSFKFDINSMYPFVMSKANFPNPANLNFLENCSIKHALNIISKYEGMAKFKLYHKKSNFGFLPVKVNNKLMFPIGNIEGYFNFNEIRFALKHSIIEIFEISEITYSIDTINPFELFVSDTYAKRINSEGIYKTIYKLFANNLYGKFQQKIEVKRTYYDDLDQMFKLTENLKKQCKNFTIEPLRAGSENGYIVEQNESDEMYLNNTIPVFGSYITSEARILLLSKMLEYQKNIVTYCDTDSIFVENDENIENSHEIGKFKRESEIVIEIRGLKNYTQIKDKKKISKIKGVPKKARKNSDGSYKYKILVSPKQSLIRNLETGTPIHITKRISKKYDKRLNFDDGSTQPIKI